MGDAYYYTKTEVEYAIKNPAIIHYLGEERPWRKGNKHKFKIQYEVMTNQKRDGKHILSYGMYLI